MCPSMWEHTHGCEQQHAVQAVQVLHRLPATYPSMHGATQLSHLPIHHRRNPRPAARHPCRFIYTGSGVKYDRPAEEYDLSQFVPVEVKAGALVLLHGENVHYSAENTSDVSRHAYSMHVVEGQHGCTWAADNWAQRPADMPWAPLYDESSEPAAAAAAS
jgi:hypothetical protein